VSECQRNDFPIIVRDAVLTLLIGSGLGLLANFVSPRGLSLRKDYFPARGSSAVVAPSIKKTSVSAISAGGIVENESLRTRLAREGIGVISIQGVNEAIKDPLYQQDLVILIDARDDRHFLEGHIPGAWQFDRYFPEKYLPSILPVASSAEKIVVYCNGGACEDSEYAAIALKEAGIDSVKISVYPGGISEWQTNHFPIEVGARKSGELK
jgi:rhodanese-related sulfurtransferase